jgi:hypothetical protein
MKLNFVSLFALVAMPVAHASFVDTCDMQQHCIDWTMNTLDTATCSLGGDGACTVEVCMIVNRDLEFCEKASDGTFSHMCDQTDDSGCPMWVDPVPDLGDGTDPIMSGNGVTGDCTLNTGEDNTGQVTGKCSNFDSIMMCQEGLPGQTLHWILKDGAANTQEAEQFYPFTYDSVCAAQVSCVNNLERCAGGTNQQEFERTWRFTIPNTTGSCDVCTSDDPPSGGLGDPHCK